MPQFISVYTTRTLVVINRFTRNKNRCLFHFIDRLCMQFLLRSREQRKIKKGAVKIGKRMRAPKNGREQGEWGKMLKGT